MHRKIVKAAKTGFCFGVQKAVNTLEKIARERGTVEPLGDVVHNRLVMKRLEDLGVKVAASIDDIKGDTVAIGAHGVSPETEQEIRQRFITVIDTTCPFVSRAQIAARRLTRAGFYVIVFGDRDHKEVRGILGCTDGNGMATCDVRDIEAIATIPKRIGILSQTTQIPARYNAFIKALIDSTFTKDSEIRIIDTICHDIRERQQATIDLAKTVDLMLVIGSATSANSNHLAEMCSGITKTLLIESADEITPELIDGIQTIGVAGGASTAEETIDQVVTKLESMENHR